MRKYERLKLEILETDNDILTASNPLGDKTDNDGGDTTWIEIPGIRE